MTSTPTRPVDNVVTATKGLQDRNINIIAGTTVENKGKLILYEGCAASYRLKWGTLAPNDVERLSNHVIEEERKEEEKEEEASLTRQKALLTDIVVLILNLLL